MLTSWKYYDFKDEELHFCVPMEPPLKMDKMNEEVKWDVFLN